MLADELGSRSLNSRLVQASASRRTAGP